MLNVLAQWNNAVAAAGADTLQAKWILLDGSDQDIRNWATKGATFEADLRALITWCRSTFNGADAKVLLVQPPLEYYQASQPGAALLVRQIQAMISRDTANVGLVEQNGAQFPGGAGGVAHVDPAGDKTCMSTEDYLLQGARVFGAWRTMLAPPSTAPLGRSLAMMVTFGDSIEAGPIQAVAMALSASASLLGAGPGTVRSGQYVWNGAAQALQLFDVLSNANTLGTVNTFVGPVATYTSELAKYYPNGILVVHMGVNGASLCDPLAVSNGYGRFRKADGTHYTTLLQNTRAAIRAALTQAYVNGAAWDGRTVDLLGFGINLGTNDAGTAGNGATFLAEARQLVADLRSDFGTRAAGRATPVVWARPHKDHINGTAAERTAVRESLRLLALEDPQVVVADMDDLELDRTDHLHDCVEASLARGRRMVQQLLTRLVDNPAAPTQPTEDPATATATSAQQSVQDAIALQPDVAQYTVNGRTVVRRSIPELIQADQYLEAKAARSAGLRQTLVDFRD